MCLHGVEKIFCVCVCLRRLYNVGLVVALLVEASLLYELADTVDFVCPSNVSQTKVVKIKHM